MAEIRRRIGISGSYGGLNLGDEAILQSILAGLRQALPGGLDITVFTRNPEDTLRRHGVDRAVPVRELTRDEVCAEVRGLDLFILGGGGILFDAEAEIFLREVVLAHELGVPVMVYAVSAGPLKTAAAQDLVRRALGQATVVTVRERGAKKVLENIGVHREILVTADPALLLRPEPVPDADLAREGLDTGDRLVAMSVREPGPAAPDIDQDLYHSLLADAADFLIDRLAARIVFLPMERGMKDLQHAHAVIARMLRPQRAWVLRGEYSPGQVLDLMRRFDFAVGMRLHFLIFAAIQRVPFVALPYSTKVQSFLDDLQLVMPPLNLVNAGRLLAHIDQFWDGREAVRARIDSLLPDLQRRAEDNTRIALDLLRRTGPAGADGDRPAAGCPA